MLTINSVLIHIYKVYQHNIKSQPRTKNESVSLLVFLPVLQMMKHRKMRMRRTITTMMTAVIDLSDEKATKKEIYSIFHCLLFLNTSFYPPAANGV